MNSRNFLRRLTLFARTFGVIYLIAFFWIFTHARDSKKIKSYYDKNKVNIVLIGASNIGYNYNFNQIRNELPNCKIVTCSLLEPHGISLLIENLERLDNRNKYIAIWDLPYTFFEKQKFLPIESGLFISQYTRKSFMNLFTQSYSIKSIIFTPFSCITNWNEFNKKQIETFHLKVLPNPFPDSSNISDNVEMLKLNSIEFDKNYICYLHTKIKALGFLKNYFWRPAVLKNGYKISIERKLLLEKKFVHLITLEQSEFLFNDFFDKCHHLNLKGRKKNTDLFVRTINRLLKK